MNGSQQPSLCRMPVADGITLVKVELHPELEGFDAFLTPWVLWEDSPGKGVTLVVDPGPAATISQLVWALEQLHVENVDYVLVTHVHIDHAGGLALLLRHYPGARVVAHPQGHQHLLDPSRLWEGSLKTLGDLAKAYGRIEPISVSNLVSQGELPSSLQVIPTPGHAPHHQSYLYRHPGGNLLFAGEAAGIFIGGTPSYMRPATPPRFFFEVTISSLEALMQVQASWICYGHCGFSAHPARLMAMHREQLLLWREVISEHLQLTDNPDTSQLQQALLGRDPLLAGYFSFDSSTRQREDYFFDNSIKGFVQYLQSVRGNR